MLFCSFNYQYTSQGSFFSKTNVRELLKTSVRVSTSDVCISDLQRSCIVDAGSIWGKGGRPALSIVCLYEPPLSFGRGRAKDGMIWPQARPRCPQPARLRH